MAKVSKLHPRAAASRPVPVPIKRPCDYGLQLVVAECEYQVGSVEAYNKLCAASVSLKHKIDRGEGVQALACFAIDPEYIYPVGERPKRRP